MAKKSALHHQGNVGQAREFPRFEQNNTSEDLIEE